jgi:hypothetical protein
MLPGGTNLASLKIWLARDPMRADADHSLVAHVT